VSEIDVGCECFFCKNGKEHPARHTEFHPTTHLLLKAESLDPRDSVPLEACTTCGHTRVREVKP
jgi:hypothetical protein